MRQELDKIEFRPAPPLKPGKAMAVYFEDRDHLDKNGKVTNHRSYLDVQEKEIINTSI